MPLNRRNSRVFHRGLYRGQLETVTLLKRRDDQQEGSVQALVLFGCRRGNLSKSGQPIQTEMGVYHSCQWLIPCTELRRVGVNYLNVLDRIIDQYNLNWQPETDQSLVLSQFDNYYQVECVRIDPSPNAVLLGIPSQNVPGPDPKI